MTAILEKISNYNLFNYLLPGILYTIISSRYANLNIPQENLWEFLCAAYFFGLTISRVGSIVIAPGLKKLPCQPQECTYQDFLNTSEKDPMINLLSSERNVYRNIIALGLTSLATIGVSRIITAFQVPEIITVISTIVILTLLFIGAYIKQSKFIIKRIKHKKS